MPESDYDDFDDNDLLTAENNIVHEFADTDFEESPRPPKRQRIETGRSYFSKPSVRIDKRIGANRDRVLTDDEDDAFDPAPHPVSFSPEIVGRAASAENHVKNDSAVSMPNDAPKNVSKLNSSAKTLRGGQYTAQIRSSSFCGSPARSHGIVPVSPIAGRTGVGKLKNISDTHLSELHILSDSDDAFAAPQRPLQSRQSRHETAANELDDLPSDAFDSSSPQKENVDAILVSSQPAQDPRRTVLVPPQGSLRQTTLFGHSNCQPIPTSQINKRHRFVKPAKDEPATHHKLNYDNLSTWIYPTNIGSIRDYQYNIVQRGLFHNLLVALPTGLGKTFIAATIMLNWYRWTKDAQIVFVAPTKPLVSQQIQACFGIAGIPRSETTMLTGGVSPGLRTEEWSNKRVFFMTPQTMINDLKTGICDPKRLVLLVVDEAHKATGGYAYAEIARFVRRFNESFRVLALTATPGADVESVQAVIDSLDISRVEIRTEQSLDIRQYVHSRQIDKHVFQNTDEMIMCMDLYSLAVKPVLSKLNGLNAYWVKDPLALTPFGMTKAIQAWFASDAGRKANWGLKSVVKNAGAALASLAHSMDLLKYHGMGPFLTGLLHFQKSTDEDGGKFKKQICQDENFQKLLMRLKAWVDNPEFIGHPKLEFLQERVMTHFLDCGEGRVSEGQPSSQTRVMIFAHWRDSAEEIVRILKRNEPMIRPHVFVGQAAARDSEGMSQKRQLEIIHKFKTGVYNTLVATSIGEEGLDIGEIDLIICYDSKASPIRMLQRMGRTGRKRAGRIILLQMSGKEEDDATKAKDNYEKMQEMIAKGDRFTFHDSRNRRMIPKEIHPVVDRQVVEIPPENSQPDLPEPKKRAGRQPKRPPKKFHMPDNVVTSFMTASRLNGKETESDEDNVEQEVDVPPVELSVTIPSLSEVILTPQEQSQLDLRYLNVADNADEVVMPEFDRYPLRQRRPFKTHAFPKPGLATKNFVRLMDRVHRIDMDESRRMKSLGQQLHELQGMRDSGLIVSDVEDAPRAFIPPAPPVRKVTARSVPHVSATTVGSDESEEDLPPPPITVGRPNKIPRTKATTPRRTPAKKQPAPSKATTKIPIAKATSKAPSKRVTETKTPSNGPRISDFIADGAAGEGRSSPPPATDPHLRIRSQAISLGESDTSGAEEDFDEEPDSELAAFVADDEEEIVATTSSPRLTFEADDEEDEDINEAPRARGKLFTRRGRTVVEERIQGSDSEHDIDDDDELPDVSTVVRGKSIVAKGNGRTISAILPSSDTEGLDEDKEISPVLTKRKPQRRIVDSDDSDE